MAWLAKVSDILMLSKAMLSPLYLHPLGEKRMEIYKATKAAYFSEAIRTSLVSKALHDEATRNLEKSGMKIQEAYSKDNKTQIIDYAIASRSEQTGM